MPIGNNDLFFKERIYSGQQIAHFSGEPSRNRSEVQHARAVFHHGGGYVITNHTETYGLDILITRIERGSLRTRFVGR